jgi:hypothetical protein
MKNEGDNEQKYHLSTSLYDEPDDLPKKPSLNNAVLT